MKVKVSEKEAALLAKQWVHLKVDEWEGKQRNKVSWWVTDWKTPQQAEDDVPF